MADVTTRMQIAKLAQLLNTDPAALASLAHLGAPAITALRKRMSDELFDDLASTFDRVSKLAPLLPNGLVATIASKAIPPQVAGTAAGALGLAHPSRIAGILGRLTPQYLADAAPYVDPRAIPIIASQQAGQLLIPTANELLRRGEYLTASEFIENAPDEFFAELAPRIADEALIRTVALVSSTARLNAILRAIPLDRLRQIMAVMGAGTADMIVAVLTVLSRAEAQHTTPLAHELFDSQDIDGITRILATAADADLLPEVLDLTALLSEQVITRIAQTTIVTDPSFDRAIRSATTTGTRRRAWQRIERATAATTGAHNKPARRSRNTQ